MGKKEEKTNVMRVLDALKAEYEYFTYDNGTMTAGEIARCIGVECDALYKTLVCVGKSGKNYVFMVRSEGELDLKKAAQAAGDKSISMVAVKELLPLTGYIRGGCSPVGMKKKYPTHFDESCVLYDEIAVSAGARGHQMILSPEALARLVGAEYADITK